MPESRYEPSDTLVPETPEGYREPESFEYPPLILFGLAGVLVLVSLVGFGVALGRIQGQAVFASVVEVTETDSGVTFAVTSGSVVAVVVGAIVVTTVLHELVHGIVYRRRGYRVSYGVVPHLGAFYAASFHQFQTRADNLVVGIAPLVVLDLAFFVLLFVPIPLLAFGAFIGLVFNTAGAAGDLYLVFSLLRMPPGTFLYDSDIRHSYVFYPE